MELTVTEILVYSSHLNFTTMKVAICDKTSVIKNIVIAVDLREYII